MPPVQAQSVAQLAQVSDPLQLPSPQDVEETHWPLELQPTVVWVHGGAWLTGDKSNQMADKIAWFGARRWLLISINYRLSPNPPTSDPSRVMYPAHPTDVAAALDYVHQHATELGADSGRVALPGHSAGAHLVALTTTDESFLAAHGKSLAAVRCVGSFDTEAYDVPAALATASAQQKAILENAFGTQPTLHAQASPQNHVASGKGIPPHLLATRGAADRRAIQEAFRKALADAGVSVTMIDATGLSHAQVNESIGAPGDTVMTPPLLAFLQTCFQ